MSDARRDQSRPQSSKKQPNVKPSQEKKDGANQGTSERRRRTRRSLRRSHSNDTENRQSGVCRGRERDRGHDRSDRQRGRSEESRRRTRENESDSRTKQKPRDDLEDTECIVCFCSFDNVFKTPKLLACGHTFCLECLARINVTSPEIKTLSCPICREPTAIRHGRDLPHLGNNEDVFRKLPPEMQRALSVRFKRSEGKLILKKPPQNSTIKTTVNLPVLNKKKEQTGSNPIRTMEEGLGQATMVNVGRPPNRMRGRMRRLLYSNNCYYVVVAAIILVTVALMLVGIFSFVIMPYMQRPSSSSSSNNNNNNNNNSNNNNAFQNQTVLN